MNYRRLFTENIIEAESGNVFNFFHGGDLDNLQDFKNQKSDRIVYGTGLNLTNRYDIAKKYVKGSRKLYHVVVNKGNDINNSKIDFDKVDLFLKTLLSKKNYNIVIEILKSKLDESKKVKGYFLNNILLNHKMLKPSMTGSLISFYTDNGIDYDYSPVSAFGQLMILYNVKKIKKITQIKPKDTIKEFEFNNKE